MAIKSFPDWDTGCFEKAPFFSSENWRKSPKIVIITLAPRFRSWMNLSDLPTSSITEAKINLGKMTEGEAQGSILQSSISG
jgi:hypothetical protein